MSAAGIIGRVALWLGVAAFFAANIWDTFWLGQPTGLVGFAAFPVVGAWILTSRPRNAIGWLLYVIGFIWTISGSLLNPVVLAHLPAAVEAIGLGVSWPAWTFLPLIGAVFPTGRFESRLGRVSAAVVLGFSFLGGVASAMSASLGTQQTGRANPLALPAIQPVVDTILGPVGIIVFVAGIVGIIVDVAIRWRRSTDAVRLQYRWLFLGLTLTVVCVASSGLANVFFGDQEWVAVYSGISSLSTNLIPITILIAVTRHGLYSIGRVVSRTVSYAVVTLLAVGVYASIVTSVTLLLPNLPSIGVALATLAAAALFLPVLRWVQRRLDRRFDRERYNAQAVVDGFGEHLRTDVTPDSTRRRARRGGRADAPAIGGRALDDRGERDERRPPDLIWAVVTVFIAEVAWFGVHGDWTMTGLLGFAIIGAVILTERPGNVVGRFLIGIAIAEGVIVWEPDPGVRRTAACMAREHPLGGELRNSGRCSGCSASSSLPDGRRPDSARGAVGRPVLRCRQRHPRAPLELSAPQRTPEPVRRSGDRRAHEHHELAVLRRSPARRGRNGHRSDPALASCGLGRAAAVPLVLLRHRLDDRRHSRGRRGQRRDRRDHRRAHPATAQSRRLARPQPPADRHRHRDHASRALLDRPRHLPRGHLRDRDAPRRRGLRRARRGDSPRCSPAFPRSASRSRHSPPPRSSCRPCAGCSDASTGRSTASATTPSRSSKRSGSACAPARTHRLRAPTSSRRRSGPCSRTTIGLWDRRENAVKHDAPACAGSRTWSAPSCSRRSSTAIVTRFWVAAAGWGFIGFLIVMGGHGMVPGGAAPPTSHRLVAAGGAGTLRDRIVGRTPRSLAPDDFPRGRGLAVLVRHDRADLETWSFILPLGLMLTQVPLRFPTGRLPSPRWRWFSWTSAVAIVAAAAVQSNYARYAADGIPNPAHIPGIESLQFGTTSVLIIGAIIGSFASLFVRYRSASAQSARSCAGCSGPSRSRSSAAMIDPPRPRRHSGRA